MLVEVHGKPLVWSIMSLLVRCWISVDCQQWLCTSVSWTIIGAKFCWAFHLHSVDVFRRLSALALYICAMDNLPCCSLLGVSLTVLLSCIFGTFLASANADLLIIVRLHAVELTELVCNAGEH